MDFVLNKQVSLADSDGNLNDHIISVNCKVELNNDTGEASFYEEHAGQFVISSTQPWECLPDGTRKNFTSEAQCVEFYKRANNHVGSA